MLLLGVVALGVVLLLGVVALGVVLLLGVVALGVVLLLGVVVLGVVLLLGVVALGVVLLLGVVALGVVLLEERVAPTPVFPLTAPPLLPLTVPPELVALPAGLEPAEGLRVAGVVTRAFPTLLGFTSPVAAPPLVITVLVPPGRLVFTLPLFGVLTFPPALCLGLFLAVLYLLLPEYCIPPPLLELLLALLTPLFPFQPLFQPFPLQPLL